MESKQMESERGSGNVFRDFGHGQAEVAQFKAILAAEIIKVLDREGLSVRRSQSYRHCVRRFFPYSQRRSWAVHS